jgi:hypothetical protein
MYRRTRRGTEADEGLESPGAETTQPRLLLTVHSHNTRIWNEGDLPANDVKKFQKM